MANALVYSDNERDRKPFDLRFGLSEAEQPGYVATLNRFAWQKLGDLAKDNPGLLVFPPNFEAVRDGIEDYTLFDLHQRRDGNRIQTGNLAGVFGLPATEGGLPVDFHIRSRFDTDERQYFLFYLLERVFGVHAVDLPTLGDNGDRVLDLAVCLFPTALKAALAKGMFRTYQRFSRNDDNATGSLDVDRHIIHNIPFSGRIAYTTRERSTDNALTQLVRHTVEYISSSRYSGVLSAGREMRECVSQVRAATPTYAKGQRATVISRNLRPVRHPYYTEYTYLQKVCLKILRREKMAYRSQARSEISGVVFAVDWLWEEYLATLLLDTAWTAYLSHPRNKDSRWGEKIHLFAPRGGVAYPDFMLRKNRQTSPQDEYAILDAKYQSLSSEDGRRTCVPRPNRLQMITYLHVTKARYGLFLFPKTAADDTFEDDGETVKIGVQSLKMGKYVLGYQWNGHEDTHPEMWIVPFVVPTYTDEDAYDDFKTAMVKSEQAFISEIKHIIERECPQSGRVGGLDDGRIPDHPVSQRRAQVWRVHIRARG